MRSVQSDRCGIVVVTAALLGLMTPARANDSTAALTTGGLVFTTTADIEMRSEDLYISPKEVVVRYRFFNRSSADKTVTVAFPMPEIEWKESSNVDLPDQESDNFLNFRTVVDGQAVSSQIEQKAFVNGRDVTARLTALNVPLLPTAKRTQAILDALPKATQEQLLKEQIVRPDEYDVGKGMEYHIAPEWSLKTTYYWQQTFPTGRDIAIEHRYRPSVGGSVQSLLGSTWATKEDVRAYERKFCPDKGFMSALAAATRKNKNTPPPERSIAYVLKTGANWAGPIGDFRLVIDKGDPRTLVSFCENGVKKIGPTTFEVRRTAFTPTRDINILLIDAPQ